MIDYSEREKLEEMYRREEFEEWAEEKNWPGMPKQVIRTPYKPVKDDTDDLPRTPENLRADDDSVGSSLRVSDPRLHSAMLGGQHVNAVRPTDGGPAPSVPSAVRPAVEGEIVLPHAAQSVPMAPGEDATV